MVATLRSLYLPRSAISAATWIASSRVGQRMSAFTWRSPAGIFSSSGSPNAAVLPVPVFERTIRSLPSTTGRKAFACTGVGFV